MTGRFSGELLRSLRNDLAITWLLDLLGVPVKISEGYVRFLCPKCPEFNTATKTSTNLARCFRCKTNFNPIDLVMIVKRLNFVDAVEYLVEIRDRHDDARSTPRPS